MAGEPQESETQPHGTRHWPLHLHYDSGTKTLRVDYEDGESFYYTAEFLRVHSPSAEVQGHSPEQRQTVPGRRYVGIMNIEPVGNYAVKLYFDDLHETGIYSWEYLRQLGEKMDTLWQRYLEELDRQGLSREPQRTS